MTRLTDNPPGPPEAPEENPFRYGWRYVRRTLPDGSEEFDQVPLTLEDMLHPQYGDVMPHFSAHEADLVYLFNVSRTCTADDPTALVLFDVLVIWEDIVGLRPHSPDLSVIYGVREVQDTYSSFDVSAEGVRPTLLFEVVSPNYRNNDVVIKVEHYHRARVPFYVIVDREHDEGPVRLIGYRYARKGMQPLPLDEQGRLWLEPLGIWLGTRGNRVVCYDGATGRELGDYTQVTQELAAAEERAIAAEAARVAAEGRLQVEAAARAAAEERIRELEARLRGLEEQDEAE